jgi:hypothetical protein
VKVLTEHCQLHRHSGTKCHCSTACLNSTGGGDGCSLLTVFASGEWIGAVRAQQLLVTHDVRTVHQLATLE